MIVLSFFSSQVCSLTILENDGADHVEGLNKLNDFFSVEPETSEDDVNDDASDEFNDDIFAGYLPDIYHIQRKTKYEKGINII